MSASLILDRGWLISTAVLAHSDRPYALSISVNAAGQATSAEAFAEADRAALQSAHGYEPESTGAIDLDGSRIAIHRYRWSQNGGPPVEQARFYRADGGIGYALTASQAPPPEDEHELAELLAGLRIDPRPSVDLSQEELAAIAQLAGIPAFPGLEGREPPADAVLLAARRGLAARGTIRRGPDGRMEIEPQTAALVHAVLKAAGMIATERRTRAGAESSLLHLGPEMCVRQYEIAPGVQRLQPFPAAGLPAMLAATVGLDERPPPQTSPATISRASYHALREAGTLPPDAPALAAVIGSFSASVTARVLRRDGNRVVGGELAWIDAGEAGVWVVEPGEDSVTLTPDDGGGVLRRIADRLAGGQPAT